MFLDIPNDLHKKMVAAPRLFTTSMDDFPSSPLNPYGMIQQPQRL
jgi:hypothetical protein